MTSDAPGVNGHSEESTTQETSHSSPEATHTAPPRPIPAQETPGTNSRVKVSADRDDTRLAAQAGPRATATAFAEEVHRHCPEAEVWFKSGNQKGRFVKIIVVCDIWRPHLERLTYQLMSRLQPDERPIDLSTRYESRGPVDRDHLDSMGYQLVQ